MYNKGLPRVIKNILALLLCAGIYFAFTPIDNDKDDGWISIFNGKDIDDWVAKIHKHEVGDNYENTFRAEDGILKVRYDGYGDFDEQFGHLYYKTPFSYYHLKVEYRFVGELHPGSPDFAILNSGIMLHCQDPHTMPKDQNWPLCVEMQLLAGLGDGESRPTGNVCTPGTEVFFEGEMYDGHCLSSSSKTYPPNEWVRAEAIVYGDSLIQHIINGDTVLQYSKPQYGGGVIDRYDPAMKMDGELLSKGFIALQSEGQSIDFREIKIRVID